MATAQGGEHIYATLLLSDSYLPGALVLAHSLRDARTTKKLAVLVTLDSVSAESITQLMTIYDYVFPVPRIRNDQPANLYLMNRADLHSAFTKINLWKFTQFSKIVYIDADVVAYRAPDELFSLQEPFSAAPDIGWPDLFNTGVMALTPNMGDYYAMMAMAERGISFDGADQGLLNMHFGKNYNRLSFTYNVTPSAHYQYVPAYRHFQSSINMVHFIGSDKPWFTGRHAPHGNGPFDEMVGRWWAVYDRHYRAQESASQKGPPVSEYVQYFTKGEYRPQNSTASGQQESFEQQILVHSVESHPEPHSESHVEPYVEHQDHHHDPPTDHKPEPPQISMASWDAQRQPPPTDSKPEALNFPATHYEMSKDTTHFVPPQRYPSPPKNMWYEVPKEPPAPRAKPAAPIFPWESKRPKPTRFFAGEPPETEEPPTHDEPSGAPSEESAKPESNTTDIKSEPATSLTPILKITAADPWSSFSRSNAWDEIPGIERYVEALPWHRRTKSGSSNGDKIPISTAKGKRNGGLNLRSFKLTDFPTEVERPSLPVTPAPTRPKTFWGGDTEVGDETGQKQLPAAEGVPAQSDWVCVHGRLWGPADCLCDLADLVLNDKDPIAQLQKLAKQQSEGLLSKLGGDEGESSPGVSREIPSRALPFGSEDVKSSTHATQSLPGVLSPQPVKGEAATSILRNLSSDTIVPATDPDKPSILKPSYSGPGAAWERGEELPLHETHLPPTDEDRDVLDT